MAGSETCQHRSSCYQPELRCKRTRSDLHTHHFADRVTVRGENADLAATLPQNSRVNRHHMVQALLGGSFSASHSVYGQRVQRHREGVKVLREQDGSHARLTELQGGATGSRKRQGLRSIKGAREVDASNGENSKRTALVARGRKGGRVSLQNKEGGGVHAGGLGSGGRGRPTSRSPRQRRRQ
jgi:hypothetical protein